MSRIIMLLLPMLDIVAGLLIYTGSFAVFPSIFYYFGYAELIKGGMTWMGAIAERDFFEWMGTIDVLGGVASLGIALNFSSWIFPILGMALAAKGLYALVLSLF